MNLNWRHFAAAAFIVGAALIRMGVPVVPVVAGLLATGLLTLMRARRA